MSKFEKALPPVIMAGAIALAFSVMMFLTVLYSPDCRSPHKSITVGEVVLLAGCNVASAGR